MEEKDEGRNLGKLLMIENVVNEMVGLREQINELKALEIERQSAMKTLQASEKKFRTIIENIPQKIFMKDKDSIYVFCNEKYAADLKIKSEDIPGKTDYEFFPKELAEKYISDDKRVMATGQAEKIEEQLVCEGQPCFGLTIKTPVKDEKGETVGVLGISWDITEQKRKEEEGKGICLRLEEAVSSLEAELKAANEQLQRETIQRGRIKQKLQEIDEMFWVLFENTGTASVMIGENLIISLANKEFEKLSGFTKEELEGEKNLTQFLAPNGLEKIRAFYLSGSENLVAVLKDYECQFAGRGRNWVDIRITAAMVPGTQKAVVSLLDITDCKQAEESLRELRGQYQQLLENIHEAVMVMQDGRLQAGNPSVFKILGYTEEELASGLFEDLVYPEDRRIVEGHLRKLRGGESPQAYSFRMIRKDGNIRWLENRAVLIQWRRKPAVLNLIKDITDRKQVEKELRESIEPLRSLFNSLEKMFAIMNRQ